MNIPQYATCSQCREWTEDKCDWTRGTCGYAESQAKEGMTQAGVTPMAVRVTIAWNAKPCSEWEATQEGRRDIDIHAAELAALDKDETRASA